MYVHSASVSARRFGPHIGPKYALITDIIVYAGHLKSPLLVVEGALLVLDCQDARAFSYSMILAAIHQDCKGCKTAAHNQLHSPILACIVRSQTYFIRRLLPRGPRAICGHVLSRRDADVAETNIKTTFRYLSCLELKLHDETARMQNVAVARYDASLAAYFAHLPYFSSTGSFLAHVL